MRRLVLGFESGNASSSKRRHEASLLQGTRIVVGVEFNHPPSIVTTRGIKNR